MPRTRGRGRATNSFSSRSSGNSAVSAKNQGAAGVWVPQFRTFPNLMGRAGYESDDENEEREITEIDDNIDMTNEKVYGFFRGEIVGLRYYTGEISRGEMVQLIREPDNKFDPNAIRVENSIGEKIGHIKRDMAMVLAPVMDRKLSRIEGRCPTNKNTYSMAVDLTLYGRAENEQQVSTTLSRGGCKLSQVPPKGYQGKSQGGAGVAPSADELALAEFAYSSTIRTLGAEELDKELDKMFENLREEDKLLYAEPPDLIKAELYLHQKQALAWMIKRENDRDLPPFWNELPNKAKRSLFKNTLTGLVTERRPDGVSGGILADDMGLGKTLQVISLIAANGADEKPMKLRNDAIGESSVGAKKRYSTKKRKRAGLISSTPIQSSSPCSSFVGESLSKKLKKLADEETKNNSDSEDSELEFLRQGIKSSSAALMPKELFPEDSTTEQRSTIPKPPRKRVKNARIDSDSDSECLDGNLEHQVQDQFHGVVSNEVVIGGNDDCLDDLPPLDDSGTSNLAGAKKRFDFEASDDITTTQPRATLIICPMSVMQNWEDQIQQHFDPAALPYLKVHRQYGTSVLNARDLKEMDVVITTYQTMVSCWKRKKDPLFEIEWLRIVLDEAHTIRNPLSQMSKAACELKARRRWALTGTPLQNRLLDLWSIVKFLQIKPLDQRPFWRQCIERPITKRNETGLRCIRALMKAVAMRRTKTQEIEPGKPLVELPARIMQQETVEFSDEERELYDYMLKEGRLIVNRYIEEGTILHHYAQVLAVLTRLRQLCCHPYLVRKAAQKLKELGLTMPLPDEPSRKEDMQALAKKLIESISSEDVQSCPICLESPPTGAVMNPGCGHYYCGECINQWVQQRGAEAACPMCRGHLEPKRFVKESMAKDDKDEEQCIIGGNDWQSSVKVDAVMSHLLRLRQEDPTIKSIVVSQFTSFLDVVETPLMKENFAFTRLDGTMDADERAENVRWFQSQNRDSPTIFLLSMKAGGVGINLTAATRVFLMDPAWNPSVEEQCFDRCHRLGQTKEVTITKFIVDDSIEERMLALQEKKRALMMQAFGGGKKRDGRDFIEDVRALLF